MQLVAEAGMQLSTVIASGFGGFEYNYSKLVIFSNIFRLISSVVWINNEVSV